MKYTAHYNIVASLLLLLLNISIISCNKSNDNSTTIIGNSCNVDSVKMDTAVLLVMGQSNAANFGATRYSASCSNAYNFYNGELYPLADPLKGAKGDKGSVWSRLGDLLIQQGLAHVVIIAPVSIGGTSIQQWIPGSINNHLIVEAVEALRSKKLHITHVLWHQGESNNSALLDMNTDRANAEIYRQDFLLLVEQLRSLEIDAPVFPAIATSCASLPQDTILARIQRELASDSLGIFNGPDTDLLGDAFRSDGCHFNDKGLYQHALLWSNILLTHP